MEFQVSEKVRDTFANVTAKEEVQKALQFMADDTEKIVDMQCELALIPAPSYHEQEKAARYLEMFKAEGLTDCHIDGLGNVIGYRRGTGGGKLTLIEGHMDTVFGLDTKLEIIKEDGYIKCPSIVDDNVGCVAVLSLVRALNAAGIQTKGDLMLAGTVQEEGTGAIQGMKYLMEHHPEIEACVSVDGAGFKQIEGTEVTGIQTYEIKFKGIGGHACIQFGKIANPIHAAGRAIAKIAELQVPKTPLTTFAVTNLEAGNISSVHAIVSEATIRLNFRSNEQDLMMELKDRIMACVEEACKEETDRWGMDTITYECKVICDVPAGHQDPHAPILEAAMLASNYLGCEEPTFSKGGSTNTNRALEYNHPAVCLGAGSDYNPHVHSLDEQFRVEGSEKVRQQTLLTTLMCAGMEGTESII